MSASSSPLAVVTGAGSGIGYALTHALVARGFEVIAIDLDISAVVTHIRTAWGNEGAMVSARDVYRYRGGLQQ